MKTILLTALMIATTVSAEAYTGLVENLKNRAVTWPYEYETGKTNTCFVLGYPSDYSVNWWDHTKEAVFDGYTWYVPSGGSELETQGWFEKQDADGVWCAAWAGYQLTKPMHVTKIRFWARLGECAGRARGVKLQGANAADFSDAVTFYTVNEDDATLNAGPLDITVSNEFQSATYTYVRMWAPEETCCGNVAEVEFYGAESLVKVLSGTRLAAVASDDAHDAGMAADGDISTHYQSADDNGYWGLDLGAVKRVSGFRFIPETGQSWRCEGGMVQYATNADFSDAVTVATRDWSRIPDRQATTMTFDAISARYVRFLANGRACSLAEAEFFAPYETPAETPVVTASASDGEQGAVKLTWTAPVNDTSVIRFLRATAPGGPYATAGEADPKAETWNDTTSLGGITYYYKAQFVDRNPSGATYEGATSADYSSAKGVIQLDRDPSGALRAGCTPIWYLTAYSANSTAAALFDGDLSTFSDIVIKEDCDHQAAGIDLGEPCVITSCSVYPRAELVGRLNNVVFWGSTNVSETTTYTWWTNCVALTDRIATNEEGYVWYTLPADKTTEAMRCVFIMNDWGWAFANAAEMKVFGYRVADVESVLLAPLAATCAWNDGDAVLTWETCPNATSYRLERRERTKGDETADWSDWTTVADGLTATTYRDKTTRARKDYGYRLISVNATEVAYSDVILALGEHGHRGTLLIFR